MNIIQQFKRLRKLRKVNQMTIAGVASSQVVRFEQGLSTPSVVKFERWVNNMDCDLVIIPRDEPMDTPVTMDAFIYLLNQLPNKTIMEIFDTATEEGEEDVKEIIRSYFQELHNHF